MSTRSFVIFQDEPSEPSRKMKEETLDAPQAVLSTLSEKENLHPVTGARAGSSTGAQVKKRKNTVLATKLHIPPAPITKKRQSTDSKSDTKKRRVASTKSNSAAGGKAEKTAGVSSLLKKVREMPVVEEEAGAEQDEKAAQASVDAKCYDLTVSPLADVSKAFDQVPPPAADCRNVALRILSPKKSSTTLKAGVAKTTSAKFPASAVSKKLLNSAEDTHAFSTPERKRIYAAFTFSSPSPASKRVAAARSGLDMFGDIEFRPS